MHPRHKKHFYLTLPLTIIFFLTIYAVFELKGDDVKGQVNIVRKIFYEAARLINPAKPAVRLAVTFHRQEHPLSCEVASLLMALRYKGVAVTESELIQQMPVSDPGSRGKDNTWGDPNLGFVGNIDGKMPNTGYGVYEKPIYVLADKYRPAKILTDASINDLVTELTNNNPVVVWGVVGKGKDISWQTPQGQIITAKLDEHVRTLIGFTGTSDQPELMILLDPIYGEVKLKVTDFLKNWAALDNKAVVIY